MALIYTPETNQGDYNVGLRLQATPMQSSVGLTVRDIVFVEGRAGQRCGAEEAALWSGGAVERLGTVLGADRHGLQTVERGSFAGSKCMGTMDNHVWTADVRESCKQDSWCLRGRSASHLEQTKKCDVATSRNKRTREN